MDQSCFERISFYLSARELSKIPVDSHNDAFCKVTVGSDVFYTSIQKGTENPIWPEMIIVKYKFEERQEVEISIFHAKWNIFKGEKYPLEDEVNNPLILTTRFVLFADLMKNPNLELRQPVVQTGLLYNKPLGTVIVRAEKLNTMYHVDDVFVLNFSAHNLKNVDFCGKSDPFLVIWRKRADGAWMKVWVNKPIMDDLNPVWPAERVSVLQLCNGDLDAELRIEIWDYESSGNHQRLGRIVGTSLGELLRTSGSDVDIKDDLIGKMYEQAKEKTAQYVGKLTTHARLEKCPVAVGGGVASVGGGGGVAVDFPAAPAHPVFVLPSVDPPEPDAGSPAGLDAAREAAAAALAESSVNPLAAPVPPVTLPSDRPSPPSAPDPTAKEAAAAAAFAALSIAGGGVAAAGDVVLGAAELAAKVAELALKAPVAVLPSPVPVPISLSIPVPILVPTFITIPAPVPVPVVVPTPVPGVVPAHREDLPDQPTVFIERRAAPGEIQGSIPMIAAGSRSVNVTDLSGPLVLGNYTSHLAGFEGLGLVWVQAVRPSGVTLGFHPAKATFPAGPFHPTSFHHWDFADYVIGGCELSLVVAIDFTASNANDSINNPSLHDISPQNPPNEYKKAITSVGRIVQQYDSDKRIPVLGFGARLNGQQSETSHCFDVSEAGESAFGVEGVLAAYEWRIGRKETKLSGDTRFAPIIQRVVAGVSAAGCSQAAQKYTILLILTDGDVNDMEATKSAVIQAATHPMSIVVVGVGAPGNYSKMKELDGDEKRLSSKKSGEATRDIVQFVQFRDATAPEKGPQNLEKETLHEIPSQVLEFMLCHGILPNRK